MLPSPVSDLLELDVQSKNKNIEKGLHIAAPEFSAVGSVHASGEAYVTVKNVYGSVENKRSFQVDGSVHQTGHEELTIENHNPIKTPPASTLPEPEGFVSAMKGDFMRNGERNFHIDTLVLFDSDRSELVKALDKIGFDCYDNISVKGEVHETGTISVVIEDVVVLQ